MNNYHRRPSATKTVVLGFVLAAGIAGCNLANTLPPVASSVFTDGAPVVYRFSESGELVKSVVDHSREGIVIAASLEELALPDQWAKVEGTSSHTLYNISVDPTGGDISAFVSSGGSYYAKYLQVGTGDGAKVFTATPGLSTPTWTNVTGDVTLTLSTTMVEADRKWYWEQMAAGNYMVLDAAQASWVGMDYTRNGAGDLAFAGVTKANRWLKSYRDTSWKAGRDALVGFIQNKVLTGTDSLTKEVQSGRWFLGVDDTAVASGWDFTSYFGFILEAYKAENTTADVVTSPSS